MSSKKTKSFYIVTYGDTVDCEKRIVFSKKSIADMYVNRVAKPNYKYHRIQISQFPKKHELYQEANRRAKEADSFILKINSLLAPGGQILCV